MIRWNKDTRSLTFTVPRWKELVHGKKQILLPLLLFVLALDFLMAFVDLPLAERMRAMQEAMPNVKDFFEFVTEFGDSKYYLVPIALVLPFLLAVRQAMTDENTRRMLAWVALALVFVFVCIAWAGIVNDILKIIFGRTRPKLWFSEGQYGFAPLSFLGGRYRSFPSGHSNTAFALATALAVFLPRWRKALFLAAGLVALSRVTLTQHYLSDIIAGSVLGVIIAGSVTRAFVKRGWVFVERKKVVRVAAPGVLLAQKIRAWLHERFGLKWGVKGKLPG